MLPPVESGWLKLGIFVIIRRSVLSTTVKCKRRNRSLAVAVDTFGVEGICGDTAVVNGMLENVDIAVIAKHDVAVITTVNVSVGVIASVANSADAFGADALVFEVVFSATGGIAAVRTRSVATADARVGCGVTLSLASELDWCFETRLFWRFGFVLLSGNIGLGVRTAALDDVSRLVDICFNRLATHAEVAAPSRVANLRLDRHGDCWFADMNQGQKFDNWKWLARFKVNG